MKTIRKTVFLDLAAAKEKGEVRSMKSEDFLSSFRAIARLHRGMKSSSCRFWLGSDFCAESRASSRRRRRSSPRCASAETADHAHAAAWAPGLTV